MSKTWSSSSALDVGGLRFGMPKIVVTPPAAAACVLVVMSSLCVKPGSRVCTCGSTIPGMTSLPVASTVRPTSEISMPALTSPTIFSPSTSTSAGRRPAGVTTSPPLIRRSIAIELGLLDEFDDVAGAVVRRHDHARRADVALEPVDDQRRDGRPVAVVGRVVRGVPLHDELLRAGGGVVERDRVIGRR